MLIGYARVSTDGPELITDIQCEEQQPTWPYAAVIICCNMPKYDLHVDQQGKE